MAGLSSGLPIGEAVPRSQAGEVRQGPCACRLMGLRPIRPDSGLQGVSAAAFSIQAHSQPSCPRLNKLRFVPGKRLRLGLGQRHGKGLAIGLHHALEGAGQCGNGGGVRDLHQLARVMVKTVPCQHRRSWPRHGSTGAALGAVGGCGYLGNTPDKAAKRSRHRASAADGVKGTAATSLPPCQTCKTGPGRMVMVMIGPRL